MASIMALTAELLHRSIMKCVSSGPRIWYTCDKEKIELLFVNPCRGLGDSSGTCPQDFNVKLNSHQFLCLGPNSMGEVFESPIQYSDTTSTNAFYTIQCLKAAPARAMAPRPSSKRVNAAWDCSGGVVLVSQLLMVNV